MFLMTMLRTGSNTFSYLYFVSDNSLFLSTINALSASLSPECVFYATASKKRNYTPIVGNNYIYNEDYDYARRSD